MKIKNFICSLLLILLIPYNLVNASTTIEVVNNLVITCTGCHGAAGISNNPLWPNLAGQQKDYLTKQLLNFKSGERKDPLMNPIVSSLTEKDIELIADYYSKLK